MKNEYTGPFYTDSGVEVSEKIKSGQTIFETNKQMAETITKQFRSYVFEIWDGTGSNSNFLGYGIPK